MNRIAEIQQRVRSGEPCEQFRSRHADATHRCKIVVIRRGVLIKETISTAEAVVVEPASECANASFVFARVTCCRQELEPEGIAFQPLQAEHPLQRDRKITAALTIFRCKTAAEEDRHKQRMPRRFARSSPNRRHI